MASGAAISCHSYLYLKKLFEVMGHASDLDRKEIDIKKLYIDQKLRERLKAWKSQ